MAYTEEELAGLTDEERAALEDEDGAGDPSVAEDGSAAEETTEEVSDEAGETELDKEASPEAALDDGNTDAAETDEGEPAAQQAPIYVAEAPADAESRLAQIAADKAALVEQFDDGELTGKEYQQQLDALAKEERAIERQLDKAQIAAEMEQQRITNERNATISGFLSEAGIPWDDNHPAFAAFNKFVIKAANDQANANLGTREILEKAYEGYSELFGAAKRETVKDPAKPTVVKKPINAPKTLAKIPAAEMTDTDEGNRFAHLDRMDPVSRENALSKLSDADRENYLRYA